ncbi:MAG TPA: alpha-amylase C-terminal beta-sheet domain-containing protein, partial [Tepidisphaeraceae bacterium]
KPTGAIGYWPAMCVTFVDDHDTAADHPTPQPFGNGEQVLQAYAYILTHPGVPCVFWSHFFDWGADTQSKIKALIAVRKSQGISSGSVVNIVAADDGKYAAIIDNKIALKLGPAPWDPGAGWSVAVDGNDFAVWTT